MQLSTSLGIKRSDEVETYLGHKVFYQNHNTRANNKLLERVRSKLDGWKTKSLSKAEHLTLAKSVINIMGVFQMQAQKLPTSARQVSKKMCLGEFDSKRKVHLVSWEMLCKPKKEGGLGLGRAEGMNMALLAKLGWRMLTQTGALWARRLGEKYGLNETDQ